MNPSASPTYSDLGEDIDNVPVNMKELMHLDSWAVQLSTTAYDTSLEGIQRALGAADIVEKDGIKKVVPRASLKQTDFGDLWWVGDKANGGFIAIHILNAMSVEGFSLQSSKNGKTTFPLTINGHVSINAQDVVPMEIYSIDGDDGGGVVTTYTVTQNLTNVTSSYDGTSIPAGNAFNATLTADSGYTINDATVSVMMGSEDVTATAYDETNDTISISAVSGNLVITAEAE